MVFELKLRTADDSSGVVFPEAARSQLNVRRGDTGWLMAAANGSLRIMANPEVARHTKVIQEVMHSYRDNLVKPAE